MSDLLYIGASGVRAYQTALNVVGENISNASTAGYVRRDVQFREVAPGASGYPLQINSRILGGVAATGVQRSWDQYRAAEVRTSTAEAQRSEAGIVWLQRVERTLDTGGLNTELTRFFTAAQGVAADPTGVGPRTALIEAGNSVAAAFRSTGSGLAATAADLEATAKGTVDELNGLAASLATTNAGLSRARPDSNGQAQLLDERDRILDRISQISAISVTTDAKGLATVALNQPGGPVLVDGIKARTIGVATSTQGTFAFALNTETGPEAIALRAGSLAGLSDAAIRVADARDTIDRVATDFADQVNTIQKAGADQDGNDGTDLFDAAGGASGFTAIQADPRKIAAAGRWAVTTPAANVGTARLSVKTDQLGGPATAPLRIGFSGGNINIVDPVSGSVLASAAFTPGQPVTLGGLVITVSGTPVDGDNFGVARTAAESRDNRNLADLASARTSGKFEQSVATLVTANASALSSRQNIAEAQGAIVDGAIAARDGVSGVNLDDEAVNLLAFQQAYQASTRVIQVSREIFQSILDIR